MQIRFRVLILALISLSCLAATAQACSVPKPGEYDEPERDEVLAIIAHVVSHDLQITKESVCSKTTYDIQELLVGNHNGLLVSEVCYVNTEPPQDESHVSSQIEEMTEYNWAIGNYPGALVAALLTRQREPGSLVPTILSQTEFRPAITSCWFAHQVNIGVMPDEMRSMRLSQFRSGLEDVFSKGAAFEHEQNGTSAKQ